MHIFSCEFYFPLYTGSGFFSWVQWVFATYQILHLSFGLLDSKYWDEHRWILKHSPPRIKSNTSRVVLLESPHYHLQYQVNLVVSMSLYFHSSPRYRSQLSLWHPLLRNDNFNAMLLVYTESLFYITYTHFSRFDLQKIHPYIEVFQMCAEKWRNIPSYTTVREYRRE